MRRRALLGAAGGLVLGGALANLDPVRRQLDAALGGPITKHDATEWERAADVYSHFVGTVPADQLLPGLLTDLDDARQHLDRAPEGLRPQLARSCALFGGLAAVSLVGVGQWTEAGRFWRLADRAARLSGDREVSSLIAGCAAGAGNGGVHMTDLEFQHLGPDAIDPAEDLITKLYVATHGNLLDDPFYSPERFIERVRSYARSTGFELLLGIFRGDSVGLALGYSLPAGARWWNGLTTPVDPDFIVEDSTRTFALCEIMTHPDWQGRGVAHRVHDELLFKRLERRATLLVDEGNETARAAYFKWGWRQIGKLRPFPDSPHYDVLILDLDKV